MISKEIFANPKVMASSGLLAMVPKGIFTGTLAITMGVLVRKNNFWPLFFVVYPTIGILFDIFLYSFRDKLWKTLPKPDAIPENWETSSEKLLQYAKQLPKVRLMRLLGSLLFLPFLDFDRCSMALVIFAGLTGGYFICVLFDWVWLSVFKLKRPSFPFKIVVTTRSRDTSYLDEMTARNSRQNDATAPGSSAWYAQKNLDSM